MVLPSVPSVLAETIYPDTLATPSVRPGIAPAMRPARKSVGLALSGGGANGMAQIGVLKAFEEEGIEVDMIAGTSIGAIIGGLYSAGYSPLELEELALRLPWEQLLSLNDDPPRQNFFLEQQRVRDRATIAIRFDDLKLKLPRSLSSAQKLTRTLDLLFLNAPYHPRRSFDDLPVRFRAVTTDLVSGNRVTLKEGSLSEAIRASSTVPVLFEPVEIGEKRLADGGLVANLAVDELEKAGMEYRIAVDTRGSMYTVADDIDIPWKAADQAITILIELQYPEQLKKADVVITPDVKQNTALDFSDVEGLIEAGYRSGKTLARSILNGIQLPASGRTSLEGCTRSLKVSGIEAGQYPALAEAGTIINNARYAEEALNALLETGWFTAVYAETNESEKNITFSATAPPLFERVDVYGPNEGPDQAQIDECFAPLLGSWYTTSEGNAALERLVRLYRESGLSLVDIENVRVENRTLIINMSDGRPGELIIAQNRNITRSNPIQRELEFDPDETLKREDVERSIDNLSGTGAFNRVSMGVQAAGADSSGRLPILVRLDEKPASVLRIGLRYDQIYKAQALFDFRNENLMGTTNSLGGWAKISEHDNRANLEYYIPRIGSTSLTFMTRLFYEQLNRDLRIPLFSKQFFTHYEDMYQRYHTERYGLSSSFGIQIGRNGQFLLDLILQNVSTRTDIAVPRFRDHETSMAEIGAEFTLDNRDSSILPSEGRYTHFKYSLAPALFNEEMFWKFSAEHEENLSFNDETAGQVGVMVGLSEPGTPFSELFFAGGFESTWSHAFAGLKENDLVGHNILLGKASIRYSPDFDLIFPSSFMLRYNMGKVWEESFSLGELIYGIGADLTWKTPAGPARFGTGKSFTFDKDTGTGKGSGIRFAESVFYFSLGHEF